VKLIVSPVLCFLDLRSEDDDHPMTVPGCRIALIGVLAIASHLLVVWIRRLGTWLRAPQAGGTASLARRRPKVASVVTLVVSTATFVIYFGAMGLILGELGISLTTYFASVADDLECEIGVDLPDAAQHGHRPQNAERLHAGARRRIGAQDDPLRLAELDRGPRGVKRGESVAVVHDLDRPGALLAKAADLCDRQRRVPAVDVADHIGVGLEHDVGVDQA
jgi:hypothetical protein